MQRFLANCSYRMLRSSLSNVANNISCSISTDFNYKTGQIKLHLSGDWFKKGCSFVQNCKMIQE